MTRVFLLLTLGLGTLAGCTSAPQDDPLAQTEKTQQLPPAEINLGNYEFRAFDPTANTVTRFEFTLAGLAEAKQKQLLEAELPTKQIRIRDRVMIVARESTGEELSDPDLVMFRRRLLKEVNRVIEKGQLDDVYVSEFRVKVQ